MGERSASEFEIKAIRSPEERYDVAILGGGLAGLTLALQLKRTRPETSVLVAEKRAEPAPDAAFKVGESTSENGAFYFRDVIGMKDHIHQYQVRKAGLRMFCSASDNSDIAKRAEFATLGHEGSFTYQIDRGRFENELHDRCVEAGAEVFRGFRVQDVDLGSGGDDHRVTVEHAGGTSTISARWIVDATGRKNTLIRKLNLATETDHHINAAWFRLSGGLDIEKWSDDEEWLAKVPERGLRARATVHLTGEGYWIWLIQLSTGPISIGLVADPRFHPWDEINEFDRLLEWFHRHEPQLAAEVEGRRNEVQDFLVVEDFSYGSEKVFSTDRWCLTGEAAGFADPLYSPGSDFIGYLNSFSTDLITRDLAGEDIEERLEFYDFFFFQLFEPTLELYRENYQFFGNPQVMVAKMLYDNNAYFSTLAFLFMHGKMTQLDDLADVVDIFETIIPLLGRVQAILRDWHELDNREWQGVSLLVSDFKPLRQRQVELSKPFEGEAAIERARQNVEIMKAVATWIFHQGAKHLPDPPDADAKLNTLALSLKPEKWEEEGLFSDDGMSLNEALELLPGVEDLLLENRGATLPEAASA